MASLNSLRKNYSAAGERASAAKAAIDSAQFTARLEAAPFQNSSRALSKLATRHFKTRGKAEFFRSLFERCPDANQFSNALLEIC
jgi:hypothetical protein